MENKKTVLVPWDFTPLAEFAVEHAVQLAKLLDNTVTLIHIIKNQSEKEDAEKKMEESVSEIEKKLNHRPNVSIKEGTIFSAIGAAATELDASIVIMGTHGIRGMQKYLGSWALKVIASSKVPFIIVQESPKSNKYSKIVLPINFRKENKEAMGWVTFLAQMFKVKFHLYRAHSNDTKFKRAIESNIYFATKYLDARGIDYDLDIAPGKKDFAKEAIDFADSIEADLIMVMTTKDIGLADYMMGAHEQYIIANPHKIPAMCINPRPPKITGSFSTSGG